MTITCQFLSTPSARRATQRTTAPSGPAKFLSTPSARRATGGFGVGCRLQIISIHALREEGDRNTCTYIHLVAEFLSTPSARRATPSQISAARLPVNFYPRPPRGGRPAPVWRGSKVIRFLSTPSARRATPPFYTETDDQCISIHALREEGDLDSRMTCVCS